MADLNEVWEGIQSLQQEDREWLFARLVEWSPFRRFLQAVPTSAAASERPITVVFDGGSRGNPGPAYGSYALGLEGGVLQVTHLEFQERMTNNEAEYEALTRALEDLHARLSGQGYDARQQDIVVRGDSKLVINQITGAWKARDPRMLLRRDRVRGLLASFGHAQFERRDREEIVEVLGH